MPRISRAKKVGSPEWAHSAAVYMRGWMHNEMGVKLTDVHWYQAGANSPGREEKVELNLPAGREAHARLRQVAERIAGRERDRLRHHRAPADLLPGRPSRRGAPVPELSGNGRGILRAHQGVADHAHHRDAQGDPRRDIPGPRAISTTRFWNRSAAASSAFSTPPCRATRCPG